MKTIVNILTTLISDIFKAFFTKGPIVKPVTTTIVKNDTNIISNVSNQTQISAIVNNTVSEQMVIKPIEKEVKMLISTEQFKEIFPNGNVGIIDSLNSRLEAANITSLNEVAGLISQTGYESESFNSLSENLNYKADTLLEIFGTHFTAALADEYAHNPEKIANRVYANRYGNGDEASGDGWKYRGHGIIQTTFKDNYQAFANHIGKSLEDTLVYVTTTDGAVDSGIYYWQTHHCGPHAVAGDITALTKSVNGGVNGLSDRENLFNKAISVLKDSLSN